MKKTAVLNAETHPIVIALTADFTVLATPSAHAEAYATTSTGTSTAVLPPGMYQTGEVVSQAVISKMNK